MDDEVLAQFTSITSADPQRAAPYLQLTDNSLEQALQLWFESDGADLSGSLPSASGTTNPSANVPNTSANPITIPSDDEDSGGVGLSSGTGTPGHGHTVESDEAMARRMQEEMYGSGGGSRGAGNDVDPETGVRAPMARTAQTLAGPGADWGDEDDDMHAAVAQQMRNIQARRAGGRPGIFNQQATASSAAIWEDDGQESSSARDAQLARATGGASAASSKAERLADLYRPPFELISPVKTWEGVRAVGKEEEKWILINVQDSKIFDCQILNRDIWKDEQIKETVREHFVFKQYTKTDPQAQQYVRFYFQNSESDDAYPHIAIVDPRTGEQVKVWSGPPAPKAPEFLMQLHEFLDRYSLSAFARNPVATRKPEKRKEMDVDRMTEEEMMQMAMQQSLDGRKASGPRDSDPDLLTRPTPAEPRKDEEMSDAPHANGNAAKPTSPFGQISSTNPHTEPAATDANTTRIQFRHPGGRVIRRFGLQDSIMRLFEWLKAEPLPDKQGQAFELISMGKNLLDGAMEGQTVEQAGLKNGTVMVEFVEG